MPNLIGVHEATVPKPARLFPAPDCFPGTQAPGEKRRHGQHTSQCAALGPVPDPCYPAPPGLDMPALAPARLRTRRGRSRRCGQHTRTAPRPRRRHPHRTASRPAEPASSPTAPGPREVMLTVSRLPHAAKTYRLFWDQSPVPQRRPARPDPGCDRPAPGSDCRHRGGHCDHAVRRRFAPEPRLRAAGHTRCSCRAVRHRRQLLGYPSPIALELGITCPFAAVLLTLAVTGFGKLE